MEYNAIIHGMLLVDFCDSLLDFISFYLVPYILDFVRTAIASYRE